MTTTWVRAGQFFPPPYKYCAPPPLPRAHALSPHFPQFPPRACAVDHSVVIYLLGPDGEFVDFFTQLMTPAEIETKVRKIMGEKKTVG